MDITQELVIVPIRQIRPYHKNVRKNDVTVEKLVDLLPKTGFNVPLLLDRRNVIVKGHSRWRAALRLGMRELPCVYTDADEETIKLDRLADNRVHEYSAWDDAALTLEVGQLAPTFGMELAALDFTMPLVGSDPAPEPIREPDAPPVPPADPGDPDDPEEPGEPEEGQAAAPAAADYIEVICNHCGTRLRVIRGARNAANNDRPAGDGADKPDQAVPEQSAA